MHVWGHPKERQGKDRAGNKQCKRHCSVRRRGVVQDGLFAREKRRARLSGKGPMQTAPEGPHAGGKNRSLKTDWGELSE